ncbi:MAG: pseudouridylate synthase [Bacteroidetes bacterium]|nr:pseudouridylate synthase [Bacteroidota bacterium]
MNNNCFIPFKSAIEQSLVPDKLNDPFGLEPPEICKIAAKQLQVFILENQSKWEHNFGSSDNKTDLAKGKMFGVLVARNCDNELGYVCTFSGKIKDNPHPSIFVPSLFTSSANNKLVNAGMTEIDQIGIQIKALENTSYTETQILQLKKVRKRKSVSLQQKIFNCYQFLNKSGEIKSLENIFNAYSGKKPAAGAGECAAPKLLQYAFKNNLKPIAIAEFWWGEANKSNNRIHGEFYPACNDKCRPILGFMLD